MRLEIEFAETDMTLQADFGELYEKPQKEVYDSGFNDGYEVGNDEGYDKGYKVGETDGYTKGETTGYNNGYTTGKTDGYNSGYSVGESKGYENGYDKGYDVGFTEGKESASVGASIDDLIDGSITEIYSEVETVRDYALYNCQNLTTGNLPKITRLNIRVFSLCTSLKLLSFSSLKSIESTAFYGSTRLIALIIRAESLCSLSNKNAFTSTPIASGTGYIYVPSALVDSYKSATNWSTYANQFRALEDYTVDGTITGELDLEKIGA